jgi:hypothetical protein
MAIATTVRSFSSGFNSGFGGWINLRFASNAGISAATPLTITSASGIGASGPIVVTPYQELPNTQFKCRITTAPAGPKNYLFIRAGDTVTG